MMKKRYILNMMILLSSLLLSCGGGGGGGGGSDAGGESGKKYTLTASVVGGNGSVIPTSGTYDDGTVVTLSASPASGYQVKAWNGTDDDTSKDNTNTITISANRTVTVEFQLMNKYYLTASVEGGNGSVAPTSGTYDEGAVVTLSASPASGYQVKTWNGTDDDSSRNLINTITMNANHTVTVEFQSEYAENITQGQAEDVLYAAYAGIGYNALKSDTDDDEALYNIMLDDLNTLTYFFIADIFSKQFLNDWFGEATKLCLAAALGTTVNYQYATGNMPIGIQSAEVNISEIKNASISGESFICDFRINIKVKFNSDGYAFNNIVYKGDEGSVLDLEADLKGKIKYITDNGIKEIRPSLESVSITAHKSLSATYSGDTVVKYREWNIHYGAKDDTINLYLIPMISSISQDYVDIRSYSLNGDFDILKNDNKGPYSYYYDMEYGQFDATQYPIFGMYIVLGGEVSVPRLNGAKVKISCPGSLILDSDYMQLISIMRNISNITPDDVKKWIEDTINSGVIFNDFITRNDTGTWTTGKLTVKPVNSEFTATFDDGSVQFPGGTPIPNWQDELDPIN